VNCNWLKENLSSYIDGEVNFLIRWKIKRHLRLCLDCRRELEERELLENMGSSTLPRKNRYTNRISDSFIFVGCLSSSVLPFFKYR